MWGATHYSDMIETLLLSLLLGNANSICNGELFGPVAPIAA